MPVVRKIAARVVAAVRHTENVCTLTMEPEEPAPQFRPGQFLHFALDPYDPSSPWPESRVFSIASSPTRSSGLRITFAVKGPFTQRMLREAVEGARVWLKLPYGSFTMKDNGHPKALVAGGTGITPFVSFLEYAIDTKSRSPIYLYYGVRSPELIVYEELIEECRRGLSGFFCVLYVEQGEKTGAPFRAGRLRIETIADDLAHVQEVEYYLSGPFEMVKSFESVLRKRGIGDSSIFVDDWG